MRLAAGLVLLAAALVLLVVLFPWDLLRGPLNRYVTEKTGRHFEITRKLDVKVGRTTQILADGIEFANPEWARDPYLVKAESARIDIRLFPLFSGRIVLPLIELSRPRLGLQIEEDGRRSWALGRDTSDPGNFPEIGALVVDEGSARFVAPHKGADIRAQFAIEKAGASAPATGTGTAATTAMPLSFKAGGSWRNETFSAEGRTGNVLYLSAPLQQPFPVQVSASAGATSLRAEGSVASLATLEGANVSFNLQGRNLADLYELVGVVLPGTPRYALSGRLGKQGDVWQVRQIKGRLGNTDLSGELAFDQSQRVPFLKGQLRSAALDFDDLAPLIGLPEGGERAATAKARSNGQTRTAAAAAAPAQVGGARVLPTAPLDLARLKAMNADVQYAAARIVNAPRLPLERGSVHVVLKDSLLQLDAMDLGVAGGKLVGHIRVNGKSSPAAAQVKLDARALELGKLFPSLELTRASFGKIHGQIDLRGAGNSAAQMLGGASGNFALLMGKGQVSNLLLEFAGLDGAEIMKFLAGGDRNVQLRCAATAFDVEKGLMTSRALVLDTTDTVILGSGTVNLANESMDLTLRPRPKDPSILSLRSPLKVRGTFGDPEAGLDKSALAGRAGLALALGAINPLLALAATIETGPGQDTDCGAMLREAASPGNGAGVNAATRQTPAATQTQGAGPAEAAPAASPRPDAHYPIDKR